MENVKHEFIPNASGVEPSIICLYRHISREKGNLGNTPILHYHEHFELLYNIRGIAKRSFGDRTDYLNPGDLTIINSRKPHDGTSDVDDTKYFVIKFLPEVLSMAGRAATDIRYLIAQWQKTFDYSPIITADELRESGIDKLMEEIIYEWEHKAKGYESVIRSNLIKIFIWTLRKCCPDTGDGDNIPESLYAAMQPAFEAAEKNLTDFTAEDAAKLCNLSYSYFSRNFKKAFGMSFTAYHEKVRLQEAERMLFTTDKEITEIAAEVSFATTSYFIERFRIAYGTTPRAFRANVKRVREKVGV